MVSPRLRPRFEINVPFPVEETIERLTQHAGKDDRSFESTIAGRHLHLNIRSRERRIWSPHLNLEVLSSPAGSLVKGHFGPRSDIWTLVMALYAICGFLVVMGLLFAASQWMLGMTAWAFWIVAGALVVVVIVYILALIGQAFSQDQMHALLSEVEEAIGAEHSISD